MKKSFVGMLLIVSALYSSSLWAAEAKKVEKKNFKMRQGGYITVIGDNGLISVESWNRAEVEVTITKRVWDSSRRRAEARLKKLRIDSDHRGDRLVIRYVGDERRGEFKFFDLFDPDNWHGRQSPEVDFELKVPQEVDLRLENDEGDIEVFGVTGDFELDVDEGDLVISKIKFRDLDVVVDEGNVEISDFESDQGRLTVEADEGEVVIKDGIAERVEVDCDEGDIFIQEVSMLNCTISADEGDLEVEIHLEKNGDYVLDTDEGDIRVWIDKDPDVELDLQTDEGSIRSDFRLDIEELDDGERISQVLKRGGARLQIFADEGDIILK